VDTDRLSRQLESLRRQMAALTAHPDTSAAPPPDGRAAVLEEFHSALHELQVAERELRKRGWVVAGVCSDGAAEHERYRDLFEFAPEGYLVTDMDGAIQEANRAAAALLHIPPMCPAGKSLTDLIADEERPTFRTELDRLRRIPRDQVRQWTTRLQPLQGPPLDVALRVAVVREPEGRPSGLRWLLRDVTETKRAADKVRESEAYLRLFAEQVPAIVWTTDTRLCITSSLGAGLAAINERPGQVVGRTLYDVLQTRDLGNPALAAHHQALQGRPAEYEMEYKSRDYQVRIDPFRNQDGELLGCIGLALDITERQHAEKALHESEEVFRQLAENIREVFWVVDPEAHRIVYVGPAYEEVWGRSCRSLYEQPLSWMDSIAPEDRQRVLAAFQRQAQGSETREEYRIARADGSVRWIWDRAFPIRDEQGRVWRVAGIAEDITERKQAEAGLRESEERLQRFFEAAFEGIAIHEDGIILDANQSLAAMFGYPLIEIIGKHILDLGAPESHAAVRSRLASGEDAPYEATGLRKDSSTFPGELCGKPIPYHGRTVRVTAVRDISERKRSEAKLQEFAQRLQALSRRLLEVQELERRHLARELHDEIGQTLTGLKLTLEMARRLQPGELHASLAEAQALMKDLTTRVRDLSLRLRPTMLDDLGLRPALLWHFERYTAQTKVQVVFEQSGLDRRFAPAVETAAYRIVQEALTNVARHAGAGEVTVRIWLDQELLCLQIEDPGIGFDPDGVRAAGTSSGLSGMQERAKLLGGRLTVDSGCGAGTRLTAELPVSGSAQGEPDDVDFVIGG
jgi:PAS domain S-box-containing protein